MKTYTRDLVEYVLNNRELPNSLENHKYFTLDHLVELNAEKPKIQQISKVSVNSVVMNEHIIKSKYEHTLNENDFSQLKYLAQIVLNWKIEYIDVDKKRVCCTNGETTTSIFVLLCNDFQESSYISNVFLEDVFIELLDSSTFMISFTGLVLVESNYMGAE